MDSSDCMFDSRSTNKLGVFARTPREDFINEKYIVLKPSGILFAKVSQLCSNLKKHKPPIL